ncbi:MAG: hypothetical protein ACI81R_000798 [Bradymonadia bacterium]
MPTTITAATPLKAAAAAFVFAVASGHLISCAPPETAVVQAPARATVIMEGAERCGARMRMVQHVDAEFCIDTYEWPGFEDHPELVGFEHAERICSRRGARLCSEREWERACRGLEGSLYPYGDQYTPGTCATESAQPTLAGMHNTCRSSFGVYDLSGNAAEWVQGALLKGGDAQADAFSSRCGARRTEREPSGPTFRGVRCCKELSTM